MEIRRFYEKEHNNIINGDDILEIFRNRKGIDIITILWG